MGWILHNLKVHSPITKFRILLEGGVVLLESLCKKLRDRLLGPPAACRCQSLCLRVLFFRNSRLGGGRPELNRYDVDDIFWPCEAILGETGLLPCPLGVFAKDMIF
jgi:hypothetical protein